MSWFRKNCGDAMLASECLSHIEAQFVAEYGEQCGRTRAVFIRHESEGRLHCEVVAYFSPDAAEAAAALHAEACARPARGDLSLLAGSQEAWTLLD